MLGDDVILGEELIRTSRPADSHFLDVRRRPAGAVEGLQAVFEWAVEAVLNSIPSDLGGSGSAFPLSVHMPAVVWQQSGHDSGMPGQLALGD